VQASIAYAAHRYPSLNVAGVMLSGGGAQIAGVASYLSADWSVPVRVAAPTGQLDCLAIPGEESRRALLVNAIGLSLNGGD
jgi:Tfp pilus assembly PilM family ATPase